jgi:hypothetical protein
MAFDPYDLTATSTPCCVEFSSLTPGQKMGGAGVTFFHKLSTGAANTFAVPDRLPQDKSRLREVNLESAGAPPYSPNAHPWPTGWDRNWLNAAVLDPAGVDRVRVQVKCCSN